MARKVKAVRIDGRRACAEGLEGRVMLAGGLFRIGLSDERGAGWEVWTADMDGDGDSDVMTGNGMGHAMRWNNGRGGLAAPQPFLPHTSLWPVEMADVDGNGAAEVIAYSYDAAGATVLRNRGDGIFSESVETGAPGMPTAADLDMDGDLDLIVVDDRRATMQVLRNEGGGVFTSAGLYGGPERGIAVGDLDGDGDPDIAAGTLFDVLIFTNHGDGTFDRSASYRVGTWDWGIAVNDLYLIRLGGRGTASIVATGYDYAGVSLLRNRGDGSFDAAEYHSGGYLEHGNDRVVWPADVAVADFDNDGIEDLAIANSMTSSVALMRGGGDWSYEGIEWYAVGRGGHGIAASDLDGDGDVDLVTNSWDTMTVLLNETVPNRLPTGITLSGRRVQENAPAGTVVGVLGVKEAWAVEGVSFALVEGKGARDNGAFEIVGNELRTTRAFDYEGKRVYRIRVRGTDASGMSRDRVFVIWVRNVAERSGVFGRVEGRSRMLVIRDEDGDRVRFRLTGGGLAVLDEEGVITVTGAMETSVLWVGVKKGRGGDGKVTLARVEGGEVRVHGRRVMWQG